MTGNKALPSYQGYLRRDCVTVAEVLSDHGYRTLMSGKWHVGGNYDLRSPARWRAGDSGHPTPSQRGFDQFFGTLNGAGSYYDPPTLMKGEEFISSGEGFFYTDAITDHAIEMIGDAVRDQKNYFAYIAYTAPHWPLHAAAPDIEAYRGTYRAGWDEIRSERRERLHAAGLIRDYWKLSPRDRSAWSWDDAVYPDWEAARMATYAAQVTCMDRGIGRIVDAIRGHGRLEDTLIMVLSDNGGCAEFLQEDPLWPGLSAFGTSPDGTDVEVGNHPSLTPGEKTTFMSYDQCWANVSNAPFRKFKSYVHEGGISTPFVASWPAATRGGAISHEPAHMVDISATIYEATGARYPSDVAGEPVQSLAGESFLPVLAGRPWRRQRSLWFEHEGHRALREGPWKLVMGRGGDWELYDMNRDRSELNDLAEKEPLRVRRLERQWWDEAGAVGVYDDTEFFQRLDRREAVFDRLRRERLRR